MRVTTLSNPEVKATLRTAEAVDGLCKTLHGWYGFQGGY